MLKLQNKWDSIQDLVALTEAAKALENEKCSLYHPSEELPQATDYMEIPMGYAGKKLHDLQIPICSECISYLSSGDWVLYYCISCLSSRWRYKSAAKLDYKDKTVVLMDCCPNCCEGKKPGVILI